jgi:CHAT domain-containing protein/tetratricopeptide (TPR) repeat protein
MAPRATDLHARLESVVTRAERAARDDPGEAQRLATRVLGDAPDDALDLVARANYVLAQVAAGAGELAEALSLIEHAQQSFEHAGLFVEAVRTNLGRINVLNEMGRHHEAIAAGESVLAALPHIRDDATGAAELAAAAHQNLGLCYELTGRFTDALASYAAAESRYRELRDDEGVGEVAYDRGLVLLALGRVSEALTVFNTAVEVFDRTGLRAHLAAALTSTGEAYLLLGEFARALTFLQSAGRQLGTIDAPWRDRGNLLATARAYLALNCFPEALDAYSDAEAWLAETGMSADRAKATWGLALARAGLDDLDGARRALDDAASAFAFSGQSQWLAAVLVERAGIEIERGETQLARSAAEDALRAARDAGATAEIARAHLCIADTCGTTDAASHLDAAVAFADEAGLGPLQAASWQALGHHRLRCGQVDDARRWFMRAVERIEAVRSTIAHEALLGNFLHDKVGAYEGLVRCELATPGSDRGRRVLHASERCRSRTLRELADGHITRTSTIGSADAHLAGELAAVHVELMGDCEPERARALRERAELLERRIARQRLDRIDANVDRAMSTGDGVPNEVSAPTLGYHTFADMVVAVIALPGVDPAVVELEVTTKTVARELERLAIQWDRCRLGPEFVQRHLRNLNASATRVLRTLHDQLIAPVAHLLPAGGALTVLPYGELHAVPWSALVDGVAGSLLDRYEITVGPSLTLAERCRERAARRRARVAVVGVADELAPAVASEVDLVADRLASPIKLAGPEALADRVLEAVGGAGIVHLAGHGWWRSDNPMYSAVRVADRWLTAAELMNCDLDGALVVLSACDTGRVRALPGDELHGLARAVLGAGAASLVACSWPADDNATHAFMDNFYAFVADCYPTSRAVRESQIALREQHVHPYYWAGFQVIGSP